MKKKYDEDENKNKKTTNYMQQMKSQELVGRKLN